MVSGRPISTASSGATSGAARKIASHSPRCRRLDDEGGRGAVDPRAVIAQHVGLGGRDHENESWSPRRRSAARRGIRSPPSAVRCRRRRSGCRQGNSSLGEGRAAGCGCHYRPPPDDPPHIRRRPARRDGGRLDQRPTSSAARAAELWWARTRSRAAAAIRASSASARPSAASTSPASVASRISSPGVKKASSPGQLSDTIAVPHAARLEQPARGDTSHRQAMSRRVTLRVNRDEQKKEGWSPGATCPMKYTLSRHAKSAG